MIMVNGQRVLLRNGRANTYRVRCPRCGLDQSLGTDLPLMKAKKICETCGLTFRIHSNLVPYGGG